MNNLKIRAAVDHDLAVLQKFEQGIISAERPFNSSLKVEDICYYDIAQLIQGPESIVIVAEENAVLVGSGYARIKQSKAYLKHDKHGYLGFMFVAPSHRGCGINQLIIEALVSWGKAQGLTAFYLDAYADNAPALKAYEKIGFKASLIEMKLTQA
jgi:GNAT superfamily N-acetyltransferase